MADLDPTSFEDNLIADMRTHGGRVTTGPLAGAPLLVMTAKGAKSGASRRAILTFSRDGRDYVVAGTKGGAPTDPVWVRNVQANPKVTVEAEGRTFEATASLAADADRDRLWKEHVRTNPSFAEYPKTANRVIPMVRLRPS